VIVSFACQDTEQFYHGGVRPAWLPPPLTRPALRKLDMLNAAHSLLDLRSPPGNRLEVLKGNLAGLHSIRINEQWRLVFRWEEAAAHDVRIIDDH
jgi:proteic killer suppression protein